MGVVNDEPASGGSLFRLRGSGERVSLADMGVYPLDQGAVVSRNSANELGHPQVATPAPDFGSALLSRSRHISNLITRRNGFCKRELRSRGGRADGWR